MKIYAILVVNLTFNAQCMVVLNKCYSEDQFFYKSSAVDEMGDHLA